MSTEKLPPKFPFYDEGGKVRDERIARKMAEEDYMYKLSKKLVQGISDVEHRKSAEADAEEVGENMYRNIGTEIASENVPSAVINAFKEYMQRRGSFENKEFQNPRLEFRKRESGSDSTTYWMINYGYESNSSPN